MPFAWQWAFKLYLQIFRSKILLQLKDNIFLYMTPIFHQQSQAFFKQSEFIQCFTISAMRYVSFGQVTLCLYILGILWQFSSTVNKIIVRSSKILFSTIIKYVISKCRPIKLFLYQFRIYAKTTFLYQIRSYTKSTCVHALIAMEIFHYMRGWKSPTRMVSDMNAMYY